MRKPHDYQRRTRMIPLANIILDEGPRPIDQEAVARLAKSMGTFGLHSPIHVETCDRPDGKPPQNVDEFYYRVVSGRHRAAAAKLIGWESIEALDFGENVFFFDHREDDLDYEIAARMWAISENLHRAELTALQRSEQIAEWIELEKRWQESIKRLPAQVAPSVLPDGRRAGPQHQPGGINAASRELGVDRTEAQRSVKIASLTEEAKAAAVDAGLDDNKSALLAAAKAAPQKQATIIRDYAEKKRSGIDRDVKERAAKEVAAMLAEHIPGEWWDALKANLYAAGAANIAHELTNITGQSIMDRRYSAA